MTPGPSSEAFPLRGIVGVIDREAAADVMAGEALPDCLGGVELRADLLPSRTMALELLDRVQGRLPVLFTARLREQGGAFGGNERERADLCLEALRRGATLVDVEWGSDAARHLAREDCPLVLSLHDFEGMPRATELERLTRDMESSQPRAIKLVPTARALHDSVRMLDWVDGGRPGSPRRIGFAMGEQGLPSRILSISHGAPYTYGSLGRAVAPGQLPAMELDELYRASSLQRSTRVFGVVGNPVAHSLSPHMHNRALAAHSIDAVYLPMRLDSLDELEPCWRPLRLRGLSVTIPFKEDAFRRADEPDKRSRKARATNTLVVDEEPPSGESPSGEPPRVRGFNTDIDGVLEPLRRRIEDLRGLSVAVLGNGGAARGGVEALKEAQASPTLYYRNAERGAPVARELGIPGRLLGEFDAGEYAAIINATSLGLEPGDPSPLPGSAFRPGIIAFDMVYVRAETAFLEAARRAGAETIGGAEMLVAQGLVQFRLFTGRDAARRLFEEGFRKGREDREDRASRDAR